MLSKRIKAAKGDVPADLVLKNGKVINVFTLEAESLDVAVCDGMIVGLGNYDGINEVDCSGKYIAPGFIDGHIHLESSMMKPAEFAKTVLPHGTTTVITDPHEIANVCGCEGIDYMIQATKGLPLDVYFALPSCVPSTPLDESGACLDAEDLKAYYQNENVVGLAEVMNYIGVINGDPHVLRKIEDALKEDKVIDGHAPGLSGKDLCAYLTAGVQSDHECSNAKEGMERIRRGQWVMIREGTAAKNLEDLISLFEYPYNQRTMLVTDDKHPGDLLNFGHIDYIIRKAISLGANPFAAIKMATFNAATYFDLKHRGAIAPNYLADLVILSDLESVQIERVYKKGQLIAREGKALFFKENEVDLKLNDKVSHSFDMAALTPESFCLNQKKNRDIQKLRVISLQAGQIMTNELLEDYHFETDGIDVEKDIIKLAVIERHLHTGHIGLGYIHGYGLKSGAIASSVAHDAHNLIVAGTNEADMALAANTVREMQGGWVIVCNEEVIDKLPLPIAGLMSDLDADTLEKKIAAMKIAAKKQGVSDLIDPFMTLAFVSLPVIPVLKLTTHGLVDVEKQCVVEAGF